VEKLSHPAPNSIGVVCTVVNVPAPVLSCATSDWLRIATQSR
jgi:hypothetical protein